MDCKLIIDDLREKLSQKEEAFQKHKEQQIIRDREQCPKCLKSYNKDNRTATIFPCSKGIHAVCSKCITALKNKTENYKECALAGELCDQSVIHVKCPVCSEVNHFPRSSKLITLPVRQDNLDSFKCDIEDAKKGLTEMEEALFEAIRSVPRLKWIYAAFASTVMTGGVLVLLKPIPDTSWSYITLGAAAALAVKLIIAIKSNSQTETRLQEINNQKIAVLDALRLYGTACKLSSSTTEMPTEFPSLATMNSTNVTILSSFMSQDSSGILAPANRVQMGLSADIPKFKLSEPPGKLLMDKIRNNIEQFLKMVSLEVNKADKFREQVLSL